MNIYVASSWSNKLQPVVVSALRGAGFSAYDFHAPESAFAWKEVGPALPWTAKQYIEAVNHPIAVLGHLTDKSAMELADVCVMVQPCGRSAAYELGWMIGAGKPAYVIVADGQEPELMFRDAILVSSVEEVIESIKTSDLASKLILDFLRGKPEITREQMMYEISRLEAFNDDAVEAQFALALHCKEFYEANAALRLEISALRGQVVQK